MGSELATKSSAPAGKARVRPPRLAIRERWPADEPGARHQEAERRARRRPMRVLEAQRWLDILAMRLAPAGAAGLIAYSHIGSVGEAAIVFATVLVATQLLLDRANLPLALMPAARIVLGLAGPLVGAGFAWLASAAAGDPYSLSQLEAVVLGAWLVLGIGAWIRSWIESDLTARVAVIGARDFAADLTAELGDNGVRTYRIVGWIGNEGPSEYRRLRWLGSLDQVREAVVTERIELLVAAPTVTDSAGAGPDEVFARVAESCLDLPVRLIAANQLYEETLGHVPIGTIDAAWYRYIMHPKFRASSPLSKRLFDLVVGAALALVSLPFVLLAALAIKLSDRGPVIYRQRRLGEHGEAFEMLKLRTMRLDAEQQGPQWSAADDPRVTPVGRALRRLHIDEAMQLVNVFRGQMTLVGPRPERPEIVADLERRFPHYTRRQLVKPGIAGWAQLRCGYSGSDLGTAWKLCHDLFYIKRRSILADALIMVETGIEAFREPHRSLRAPDERFLLGRSVQDG
jgi:lipopolysaccharide/colanic/teichoic acid biosynthesis glycosyltransferase